MVFLDEHLSGGRQWTASFSVMGPIRARRLRAPPSRLGMQQTMPDSQDFGPLIRENEQNRGSLALDANVIIR